jgi:beta-glucosidase
MTLDEKLSLLHGVTGTYVGNLPQIKRLGIPAVNMQDGPQGFRVTTLTGPVGTTTAWPSALTAASSWDRDLVNQWSTAMAVEFKGKGANIMLAPGIGIARVPTGGRIFEYLCGEDPYLGSELAYQSVTGNSYNTTMADAHRRGFI